MPRLRALLIVLLLTGTAAAGDWPGWLGPKRDGSSPEVVAPWKGDLKVLWRKPVGEGHSSPVVAGGKVFLFTRAKDKEAEELTAYDAKTGEEVWAKDYERAPFKSPFGAGPQGTPTVADGKVYTFGATGVLSCFNAADGKQVWQVDTLKKFEGKNLYFGAATSPLVEGDVVLVNVGAPGASVVAFKKDNGEVAWKALDDKASYSSPIAFGEGKQRQVVFLTAAGLRALRPSDGKLFWEYPFVDRLNESSTTPVRLSDGMLLASSVTAGSVGLKLSEKDDTPTAQEAWKNPAVSCYFSTPVPVGEHVYMVTGKALPPPQADLVCVEAKTGKVLWRQAKVGKYHAAMLRTGDDKLLMLDDFGNLSLLQPDAKEYKELAKSKVCGATWAHPALSDGRVYIRDEKELICVQVGK
jgi:outer membrane protein assembly factor BamB